MSISFWSYVIQIWPVHLSNRKVKNAINLAWNQILATHLRPNIPLKLQRLLEHLTFISSKHTRIHTTYILTLKRFIIDNIWERSPTKVLKTRKKCFIIYHFQPKLPNLSMRQVRVILVPATAWTWLRREDDKILTVCNHEQLLSSLLSWLSVIMIDYYRHYYFDCL